MYKEMQLALTCTSVIVAHINTYNACFVEENELLCTEHAHFSSELQSEVNISLSSDSLYL